MTLQQEVINALRDAALDYRAQVLACCSGLMPRRFKDEMVYKAIQCEQLAVKVDAARLNTSATDPLLDEMAEVMGKIEKYYDFPGEVLEEIAPEWLTDVIQVMRKYREQEKA